MFGIGWDFFLVMSDNLEVFKENGLPLLPCSYV